MSLPEANMMILFVKDPLASIPFYSAILGMAPIEQSPTFAAFMLPNKMMLGLWSHKTAEPAVKGSAGCCEIGFSEEDVDSIYAKWKKLHVPFAQTPTNMDFGYTFVALDPDGHRIRVYRLHEGH